MANIEVDGLIAKALSATLTRDWLEYAIQQAIRKAVDEVITDIVNKGSLKKDVLAVLEGTDE